MTLNELMNVPYCDHGRDGSGLDCWGFVRLVRNYHHNLPMLASFGTVSPDDKSGMTKGYDQVVTEFCQTEPIDGAIACHFIGETLIHVGVVINENGLKVAHTGRKLRRPRLVRLSEFERMALVTRYYIEHDYIGGLPK
ncbi:phage tail protein [Aliivibrio fischeri]|uniref:phage tail protein n=1 Tax=Aliivibrio fischeri TaxID=668 RepID=UPI00080DE5C8|nr:phage tail protein [Aliivibrio fischeri]OCH31980.1 phage tail protein [Aliivibrio fischeri]